MPDRNSPTSQLEAAAEAYWVPNPFLGADAFRERLAQWMFNACREQFGQQRRYPCLPVLERFVDVALELYEQDGLYNIEFERQTHADPVAHGRYRDELLFLLDIAKYPAEAWQNAYFQRYVAAFLLYIQALPEFAIVSDFNDEPDSARHRVHVTQVLDGIGELIDTIIESFLLDESPRAYFQLQTQLYANKDKQNGIYAGLSKLPSQEIIKRYLAQTPLLQLFDVDIPLPREEEVEEPEPGEPQIDERSWFQHCLLLAQSGAGKTNAIRWRIAQLLPQIATGNASVIVMEPKGDLIDELLHSATLYPIRDRVIILDPADSSVSVNLFEPPTDNSPTAVNETIERVSRVLNTITLDMTELQKQALTLAMLAMYLTGNPSMRSLMTILRQGKATLDLSALPIPVADFFQHDFR